MIKYLKLVEGINLNLARKYNSAKVYIQLEDKNKSRDDAKPTKSFLM